MSTSKFIPKEVCFAMVLEQQLVVVFTGSVIMLLLCCCRQSNWKGILLVKVPVRHFTEVVLGIT